MTGFPRRLLSAGSGVKLIFIAIKKQTIHKNVLNGLAWLFA